MKIIDNATYTRTVVFDKFSQSGDAGATREAKLILSTAVCNARMVDVADDKFRSQGCVRSCAAAIAVGTSSAGHTYAIYSRRMW